MLHVAVSSQGLYSLGFGMEQDHFLDNLDPLARTEHSSVTLSPIIQQLQEYFGGSRFHFDLPVDLGRLTGFQRSVLSTIRRIPAGQVWTYHQVARAIDRPKASRAVGQALGNNPIPIIIPCHRVIASNGSLGGYSGGGGLASKKLLLQLEQAAAFPG
jgi:methylated-DNA-[protein]-cysteine S-methyltransferase